MRKGKWRVTHSHKITIYIHLCCVPGKSACMKFSSMDVEGFMLGKSRSIVEMLLFLLSFKLTAEGERGENDKNQF